MDNSTSTAVYHILGNVLYVVYFCSVPRGQLDLDVVRGLEPKEARERGSGPGNRSS